MPTTASRRPPKSATAQVSRNMAEPGKYRDGHGLCRRVDKNGARFWVQRIVIRGRRREIGMGSPSLVSLAEARAKALDNHRLARSGGDPIQAKREADAVLTFEQAARTVHQIHRPTWRNAKHAAQFISTLETYAFPKIGKARVADVTPAAVLAAVTPLWHMKPVPALLVLPRSGHLMKWA